MLVYFFFSSHFKQIRSRSVCLPITFEISLGPDQGSGSQTVTKGILGKTYSPLKPHLQYAVCDW